MSRPVRFALLVFATASLASCAVGPDSSYVGDLSAPGDARILAAGMVEFVSTQLPAASSTIALDPTPADQASNALTPAFTAALRRRGFAVADDKQAAEPVTHHLRYWVTPLDNGDVVRLSSTTAPRRPASLSGTVRAVCRRVGLSWFGRGRRQAGDRHTGGPAPGRPRSIAGD